MKRVRYLAGAAGLVPAAFGLAVAPAAHAAAGPAGTDLAGQAKTVSLHHVLHPGPGADGAASPGSSAHSPAIAPGIGIAAGCKAHSDSLKSAIHNNLSLVYSYALAPDRACIGDVVGVMHYHAAIKKCEWGRIYQNGHLRQDLHQHCAYHRTGGSLSARWDVKRYFPTPVKVCVKSTYDTVGACKTVG